MSKMRFRTSLFPVLFATCLMGFAVSPAVANFKHNPTALYGNEILFSVFRNGSEVGSHSVSILQQGSTITVNSAFDLQIKFLFLTAYEFRYTSVGTWEEGRMVEFASQVNDDGERFEITALPYSSGLKITGPEGTQDIASPVYPTTHWNAAVVNEKQVLNTLTGLINNVQINATAREEVETELGPVQATRYEYSGDLMTTVWYDDSGRWVKMKFKGRDGSDIEYLCRKCQGHQELTKTHDQ